jgi:CubicO group peptidase (beta-lactamase class C family)
MKYQSAPGMLALLALTALGGPVAQPTHTFAASSSLSPVAMRVDSYLTGLTKKGRFSGAVVLARQGKILLSKGYGLADRKHHVPFTPTTKYVAGRFSTTLPVLGILQLAQRGKLALTDRVCTYISGCQPEWQPMTIRQVLNFTSGLGDYDWESARNLDETITGCKAQPLNAPPGKLTAFGPAFGTCAAVILTVILQRVSGQSWDAYMRQHIFSPAGMTNSGRVTDALKPPQRAAQYNGATEDAVSGYDNYFFAYSSALDLYRYDQALFGGTLLSGALLRALMTPGPAAEPDDPSSPESQSPGISDVRYGYGWRVGSVNGQRVVFTYGPTPANIVFPQSGITVVLIANDDTYAFRTIATTIIRDTLRG